MNEEEKKAIARVERLYKFSQDVNHTAIVLTEDTRCLGIVLNLLQQEKEKNKKLEEVIDLMAQDYINDMYEQSAQTPCQWFDEIKNKEECKYLFKCKGNNGIQCLRKYYFKKARGEEDEH